MEKQDNKTVIRIVVAACAVFLTLLIVSLVYNLVKLSAAKKRKADLEAQSSKLDQIIESNDRFMHYCQTPEFINDYAREYLNMIYRGEIPVGKK